MGDPVPPAPSRAGLARGTPEYRAASNAYYRWWCEHSPVGRAYKAAHDKDRGRRSALAYQRGDAAKQVKKAIIVEAMGGVCYDCGEDRLWLLTLHHRDPTVKEGGGVIWKRPFTYRLWAEVWSCDLLCHHCHTLRHHPRDMTAADVLRSVDKSRIEQLQFKACSLQEPSPTDTTT